MPPSLRQICKQLGKNDDADMTKGQNKGSARQPMGDGSHRGVLLMGKHKKESTTKREQPL